MALNTKPGASDEEGKEGMYHFGHQHQLEFSQHHNQQTPCAACTYPILTSAYGCQSCKYCFHVSCSEMPQQLQHPFDTSHVCKLLTKPAYLDGWFSCDACGHSGNGFSYHCSDCQIDLHLLCAQLPSVTSVPGHEHQVARVFSPPDENKMFMCGVCGKAGAKTWLYQCGTCKFDVHLGCLRGTQPAKLPVPYTYRSPEP